MCVRKKHGTGRRIRQSETCSLRQIHAKTKNLNMFSHFDTVLRL